MPATTRPRASRPRSPRIPTRPRTVPHRRVLALDGLTVDTDLGFVDLVAVKRAINGDDRVRLTEAELDFVCNCQAPEAWREAAAALGTGYTGLSKALARHRRHLAATDTDTSPADMEEG